MNWAMKIFSPAPAALIASPSAAVVLPFPSPVLYLNVSSHLLFLIELSVSSVFLHYLGDCFM